MFSERCELARAVLHRMAMRVAVPHWQGRVAPVFDVAGNLLLVDFEDGRELRREEVRLAQTNAAGRTDELSRLGADILICGAVSSLLEARLAAAGVQVVGFVCGAVEDILAGFLNGELAGPAFLMPGCWAQRRRTRQGRNAMPRGSGMGGGGGRGRMGGPRAGGPGGQCVCPKCGENAPHTAGKPCVQMTCPKCGTSMTRA